MSRDLVPIDRAQALVTAGVAPLASETVAVAGARDRVLAVDVVAAGNVPPFACSAMDGYAVTAGDAGRVLTVVGESRAGAPARESLRDGEAIRISTGARLPEGATAVVAQEDTERHGEAVRVAIEVAAGRHVRGAGEDMRAGTPVLDAGTVLGPIEIGAAIAAGAGAVEVARRPRVAVLTTGDELRSPGESLGAGEIHDANGPMLAGLAVRCGASVPPPRRIGDDRTATVDALADALRRSDVVIVSGGVSVGPHDHVKPALAQLGVEEVFWSVALQPGKPTWFGARESALVFGLPGNPVSSVVTFSLFAAPALAALQGAPAPRPAHPQARLGAAVARNPNRDQAIRVALRHAHDDESLVAEPTGAQGSHILSSLLAADALAMVPAGDGELPAGTLVPLRALVR